MPLSLPRFREVVGSLAVGSGFIELAFASGDVAWGLFCFPITLGDSRVVDFPFFGDSWVVDFPASFDFDWKVGVGNERIGANHNLLHDALVVRNVKSLDQVYR